jgi:hypothetical protein
MSWSGRCGLARCFFERVSPAASRAKLVNTHDGKCRDVLPDNRRDFVPVVLGLDQGSMGTSGVAFANHMNAMLRVRWGKFHRIVRDVKLALLMLLETSSSKHTSTVRISGV